MTSALLNRRDVVRELVTPRRDLVCVAGLGAPAYDLAAAGTSPLDFPLWGAMGGAAMVGCGLAFAQPDRTVLVVTGDGEMLMGLGALATIGVQQPPNLAIVVLDNERYGETGQQQTHTAAGVDLAAIARGCGFPHATVVRTTSELVAVREHIHARAGLLFAVVKVSPDDLPRVLPPRDGGYLTERIRQALLGRDDASEA
jgi:thiamine pyrophosphate-dependent acetolactate synthase large subunit-like protein